MHKVQSKPMKRRFVSNGYCQFKHCPGTLSCNQCKNLEDIAFLLPVYINVKLILLLLLALVLVYVPLLIGLIVQGEDDLVFTCNCTIFYPYKNEFRDSIDLNGSLCCSPFCPLLTLTLFTS